MFYVFLVLIILGSLSYYFYKLINGKEVDGGERENESISLLSHNSNPVELAYLKHGPKYSFGVAIYSLVAYKFAKRNTAGILRFINLEEKRVPSDPYTSKLVKIISIKMRSAVIFQLVRNKKLQELFDGMIEPAVEQMEKDGLLYTREERENSRFVKFIGGVVMFLGGFYAILFATSFWGFLLVILVLTLSIILMNNFGKINHLTSRGEKFSERCFARIGKDQYKKGIYSLAKYGQPKFKEKNLEAFLGKKQIDWEEYY